MRRSRGEDLRRVRCGRRSGCRRVRDVSTFRTSIRRCSWVREEMVMSVMEMAATKKFAQLTFEEKLDRLAEVAVQIGLGLRAGQELIMSAPLESLPLARRITEHAYKAGALLVTTFYSDDPSVLARYEYAADASFDYAPTWLHDGIATGFRSGAARLAIAGANPALLAKQDPAKVARANVAASKAGKPAMELITKHEINWTIVACATPEWAK